MLLLRSILSVVMSLIVFVSTSGVPLVYHYCADELDSISLATPQSCGCGDHGKEKDDCCRDIVEIHKVKSESVKAGYTMILTEQVFTLILPVLIQIADPSVVQNQLSVPVLESPPPIADIPVRFRSLLI